jgi:hypothetical protein
LNPSFGCVVQLLNHCPQKAIPAKAIAAMVRELGDTYLHCDAASASFDSTASFVSMARTIGSTQSAADWSKSWLRIPSARARGCYELAHENDKIRPPSLPPHLLIREPTLTPPSLQHRPWCMGRSGEEMVGLDGTQRLRFCGLISMAVCLQRSTKCRLHW